MCRESLEVDGPKLARRGWIARGIKRCRLLDDCHNPFALDEYGRLLRQVRVQTTTHPLGRTRSPATKICGHNGAPRMGGARLGGPMPY
jgi:hypothetical protein